MNEWTKVLEIIPPFTPSDTGGRHSGFRPVTYIYIKQDIQIPELSNATKYKIEMLGEVLDVYRLIYGAQYSFRINFNGELIDFNGNTSLIGVSTGMRVSLGSVERTVQCYQDGTSPILYFQNGGSTNLSYPSGSDPEQTVYAYLSSIQYYTAPALLKASIINSVLNATDNTRIIPVDIATNITVNITKYVDTYYDKLEIKYGDTLIKSINGITSPCDFSFSANEISIIQNLMSAENEIDLSFEISSYEDSTMEAQMGITNPYNVPVVITNATPTITSCEFKDMNATTIALTGNNKTIIKGYSDIKFYDLVAAALKGASISSVILNENAYSYVSNFNITIEDYLLSNAKLYVIDSRTNSSLEYSMTFTNFIDYFNIIKNESSYARTGYTEECIFSFKGQFKNVNFGNVANSLTCTYRYKNSTSQNENDWENGASEIEPDITNNVFEFSGALKGDTNAGFSVDKTFDVEIFVSDELSSAKYSFQVIAAIPALDIYRSVIAISGNYDETLGGSCQFYTDNGNIYVDGELFIERVDDE